MAATQQESDHWGKGPKVGQGPEVGPKQRGPEMRPKIEARGQKPILWTYQDICIAKEKIFF